MNEPMKIEVDAMLGDILSCPLNSEAASLYVVMEGIRYVGEGPAKKDKIQEFTVLYKMAPGPHGLNTFESCTVFERKYIRLTNAGADPHLLQQAKQLGKILSNIPCDENEEILLITWDHGSAFGIFRDEDPKAPTAHVRSAITDHLEHYPYLRRFWTAAMQSDSLSTMMKKKVAQHRNPVVQGKVIPEILKNWKLATAIKTWLRGKGQKKVGVLVMLNCWMMNLHTLYSMKGVVKYLVAPEGNIDNPGYNYHDILLQLYNRFPHTPTPQELAIHVVKTSHNEFMIDRAKQLNKLHPDTLSFRAIVNVRLDYGPSESNKLDELFMTLHGIIEMLHKKLRQDRSGAFLLLLQHVRALSFDFTAELVPMIDLPNYLFYLVAATNGLKKPVFTKAFANEVDKLQTQLLEGLPVVLPRWLGENCYYWNHEPIYSKLLSLKPTGFSIFFPDAKQIDPLVLDNVRDDLLLKTYFVRWKRILDKIHDGKRLP